MLNISKQQALQRWEVLPDSLREALFSEYNANTLWRICEEQHLSEDKISKVAVLLGDVILGFAHFEDLAKEISSETGINQEIANSIIKEIDRKILSPIKSDVEKNYKPAMPESSFPKQPISEIRPTEKPKPVSPLDILKETPSAPQPKLPVASSIPSVFSISSPTPSITPKPVTPPISKEGLSSVPAALTEGPLIIHKETEFKPLSENRKSLGGFFNFLNKDQKEKKEVLFPVKAKVEIGPETFIASKPTFQSALRQTVGAKVSGESEKASTSAPKIRVVHYTDFSTPLTSNPFSGKIQPKIQDAVLPPKPPILPIQKSPTPQPLVSPQFQPKPQQPQSSLRDLTAPIFPVPMPTLPTTPTPVTAPAPTPPVPSIPKRVDFSVNETDDSTKKNNNLGENIIDLRSFK